MARWVKQTLLHQEGRKKGREGGREEKRKGKNPQALNFANRILSKTVFKKCVTQG